MNPSLLGLHHVTAITSDAQKNIDFYCDVLGFEDPDGLALEIVATPTPGGAETTGGPVPAENAIGGFHGVTVSEEGYEKTARLLSDVMGFRTDGHEGNRFRYRAGAGELA